MSDQAVAGQTPSTNPRADTGSVVGPPRLALAPSEAAEALGVSRDFLDQHILPELRIVRRGRRRLIAVRELERWLDEHAAQPLSSEIA